MFIRTGGDIVWPSADLKCLSEASKTVVCAANLFRVVPPRVVPPPLVPFLKKSKFPKVLSIIELVVKFLLKKKALSGDTMRRLWGTVDPLEIAKFHLISRMQKESFPTKLSFLRGTSQANVPDRVRDLNLFLDPMGLLRS